MSLINVSHLTFAYPGSFDNVFSDVSFSLNTDWRLGLTGRNGRGKTTLFKLLMGPYDDSGVIETGGVSFGYFPPAVVDISRSTAEILSDYVPAGEEWRLLRELNLLSVDESVLDRPFETLSDGEKTKSLLAALFCGEDRFPLIDEPTNHLDMEARQILSRYLQSKAGFILVSHDRALLDGCVDHILSINRADIEVRKGNFSAWLEDKERRDNSERETNEHLKKDIKRLEAAARRTQGWSDDVEKTKYGTRNSGLRPDRGYIGAKAAKMAQRSKNLEARQSKELEEKSALLKNIDASDALKVSQIPYRTERLLELSGVSVYYGDRTVFEDLSFELKRGDRVALQGRNGCGKSSVLKLICGEDIPYRGTFYRGGGLTVSYVSQDTSHLNGTLKNYAGQRGVDETLFKAILRKLGFERTQFEKDMSDFSGGQKKKVLIAASLSEKTNLLVWDEPLNFIDVISRMQIEDLLLSCAPTMIFVEHDRTFTQRVATKMVEI